MALRCSSHPGIVSARVPMALLRTARSPQPGACRVFAARRQRPVRLPSGSPPPPSPSLLLLFLFLPSLLRSLLLLLLLLLAVSPRVRSLGSHRRQGSPSPPPPTPRSNCCCRRCRCRSARGRLRHGAPTADAASPGPWGRIAWAGPPESHSHLQSPAKLPPSSSWRNTFFGGGSAGFCVISSRAEISPSWRIGTTPAGRRRRARTHGAGGGGGGCGRATGPAWAAELQCLLLPFRPLSLLTFWLFLSVRTDKSQDADA